MSGNIFTRSSKIRRRATVHDDSRVICSRSASIEHVQGLCNQDVIDELEKIEEKEDNEIDPRWSTLKDINIKK